ncbi:MAG: helix-turn-helix transcriptional regulator, partial [Clostridia bacterium]
GANTIVLVLHRLRTERALFAKTVASVLQSMPDHEDMALGVSDLTDNALALPACYTQALESVRRCERHGYAHCFFVWEKAQPESKPAGQAEQILAQIEASVRAGQFPAEAVECLAHTLDASCDLSGFKGTLIHFVSRFIHDKQVRWVCDGDAELLCEESLYAALIRGDSVPALLETIREWLTAVAERFAFQSMDKKQQIALEIKRIIDTEYVSNITLKYLSGRVYLSSNYTHILFKAIYGYTVNHYLTQVRIQKACELLADTQYPIAQIAPMVGYEHSTYFFSIFKRMMGGTPAEYRRCHQKEGVE